MLGLVAGVILAEMVPLDSADILHGLGKPTLAMLGGFSAPVVYRILNRLVIAIETLVRGDTKHLIAANEKSVKLEFEEDRLHERTRIATGLVHLRELIGSGALGRLLGVRNEDVVLVEDGEEWVIPLAAVKKANLVPKD